MMNMIKLKIAETFIEISFDWSLLHNHVPKGIDYFYLIVYFFKLNLSDFNGSQSLGKDNCWNRHTYKHKNLPKTVSYMSTEKLDITAT